MPAPARQPVRAERVELAAGGEDDDLVGRLRVEGELELVAFLEGQRREIGHVALHRPQPALLGHDDRHRLLLDHRMVDVADIMLRRVGELRAAAAEIGMRAELVADLFDLPADRLPLLGLGGEQAFDLRLLGGQRLMLLADLKLLQLAQIAQAHVEDGFGLDIRQLPAGDHHLLGLILLADDADDLVDVEVCDQQAAEDFQPPLDLRQPVARAADQNFLAMLQPLDEDALERQHVRHLAARQDVHVEREAAFELGQLENGFHQQCRVDQPAFRHQHEANVLRAFVAHIIEQRQLAGEQEFGDLLD